MRLTPYTHLVTWRKGEREKAKRPYQCGSFASSIVSRDNLKKRKVISSNLYVWLGRRLGRPLSGSANVWVGRRLGRQVFGSATCGMPGVWGGGCLAMLLVISVTALAAKNVAVAQKRGVYGIAESVVGEGFGGKNSSRA